MVALLVAIAVGVGFVVAFELAGVVRAWRHDRLLGWPVTVPGGPVPGALAPSGDLAGDSPALAATDGTSFTFEEFFAEMLGPAGVRGEPLTRHRHLEAEPATDMVLQALIERVAASRRDVARAVSTVLRERHAELALFGEDVPARPGRLSAFADLSDVERRRVIIRVLCLLLAEDAEDAEEPGAVSEDGIVIDLRKSTSLVLDSPATGNGKRRWADVVGEETSQLPQRRRLARSGS